VPQLTRKQEDEERNQRYPGRVIDWNVEAEPSSQERPRHVRERKQKEIAPPERIDRPHRRERKEPVDEPEAPRGEHRLLRRVPRLHEDRRRVERHDVDAAHLLRDHHDPAGERRAAHARDGEELDEALVVVRAVEDRVLLDELAVHVVEVARGLQLAVAQAAERLEGVDVAVLLHIPARRFCTSGIR
jgi:hypothetical protein